MPNRPQFPLTHPLPPLIFTQHPASLYFHTENILPHLTSARNKPWPSSLSFKILTPLHLQYHTLPHFTPVQHPGLLRFQTPHLEPPHFLWMPWPQLTSAQNTPWPSHFLLTTWPHFTSTYRTLTHLTFFHHFDPTSLPHKNLWLNPLFPHTLIHLAFIYQPQANFIPMHGYFVSPLALSKKLPQPQPSRSSVRVRTWRLGICI